MMPRRWMLVRVLTLVLSRAFVLTLVGSPALADGCVGSEWCSVESGVPVPDLPVALYNSGYLGVG